MRSTGGGWSDPGSRVDRRAARRPAGRRPADGPLIFAARLDAQIDQHPDRVEPQAAPVLVTEPGQGVLPGPPCQPGAAAEPPDDRPRRQLGDRRPDHLSTGHRHRAAAQLVAVLRRWLTLRARVNLVRVTAELPAGAQVSAYDPDGTWAVRRAVQRGHQ
jgi:hypothetical protein